APDFVEHAFVFSGVGRRRRRSGAGHGISGGKHCGGQNGTKDYFVLHHVLWALFCWFMNDSRGMLFPHRLLVAASLQDGKDLMARSEAGELRFIKTCVVTI